MSARGRVYWLPQIWNPLETSIRSDWITSKLSRVATRPVITARTFKSLPAFSGSVSLLLY
jgi:hypothetical protein